MRIFRLFLLVCLAGALVPELGAVAAPRLAPHDGLHVLVKFRDGVGRSKRLGLHREFGAAFRNRLGPQRVDVVRVASVERALRRYRRDRSVEYAVPNQLYSIHVVPNDPGFPELYGLNNTGLLGGKPDADIDAPEGWDVAGGTPATSPWPAANYAVAVIDTGVDHQHVDLLGRTITACTNAVNGTGTVSPGCFDDNGHGTHASGTIAAIANNGVGIAGVAFNANIYMCKALRADGNGTDTDIAGCVNDVVAKRAAHNIRVLNLSFGGPHSPVLQAAVDNAANSGILVVAAAGNDGTSLVNFPAGYASVVSVAATDRFDARASFSNFNDDVELTAAGVDIISTVPGGFASASGTSFSSPHVAGVAGLVSFRTGQTGGTLRNTLNSTADDIGPPGRDSSFGFGRVNLCRALGGNCPAGGGPPTVEPPTGGNPGTITGSGFRLRRRGPKPKRGILVCASGPTMVCAETIRGGSYSLTLPPGTYDVSASRRGDACATVDGETSARVRVTSGGAATIDWFC